MNAKKLAVVTSIVVVLAIVAVVGNDFGTGIRGPNTLVLPSLPSALDDVTGISIRTGPQGESVSLSRRDGVWVVGQRNDYPADFAMIRDALVALSEARIVEAKTANPELYDRLGVEDIDSADASGIAIELSADTVDIPTLIVGDAEGSEYRYVRVSGEQQSVMVDRNPELPTDPADWLDTRIVDVRGPRIAEVSIRHADGGSLRIFKDESGQSNFSVDAIPEGRSLQYPGVANVIGNTLRELQLQDVARAQDIPAEFDSVTTYRTFDGLIITASSYTIDDENWLVFSADVDTQAADTDADAGMQTPVEQAAAINDRVQGWRYRIAEYQFDQLTRRIEDLLSAEAAADDAEP